MTIYQGDQYALAFTVENISELVSAELYLGGLRKEFPGELVLKGKELFFPLSQEETFSMHPGYYDLYWRFAYTNGTVNNNFCMDYLEVIRTPKGRPFT